MKASVQKQSNKLSKKRIFNIIELALQLVLLCILFCAPSYLCNYCGFQIKFINNEYLVSTVSLLFMIINVIICVISMVKNTKTKDSAWHVVIPIISAITLFFALIQEPSKHVCGKTGQITSMMITCLLFSIIILFLSFIKKSNFVVPKEAAVTQVTINNNSTSADELKKYKDLLDDGAITQEEFETKKKELLGL